MDRNLLSLILLTMFIVALRKESVDRNLDYKEVLYMGVVALRKESVDRNRNTPNKLVNAHKSLSARRAWIEISVKDLNAHLYYVALRKESVDRNMKIPVK